LTKILEVPKRDGRSRRDALLTQAQMDMLRYGEKLKTKSKTKLYRQLDKLLPLLLEDLDMILTSHHLEAWRAYKRYEYGILFKDIGRRFYAFAENESLFKKVYPYRIREKINKNTATKLYWKELVVHPGRTINELLSKRFDKRDVYYSDKIFKEKNLFVGTGIRTPKQREFFLDADKFGLIPTEEAKAVDKDTLKKQLAAKKGHLKHKESMIDNQKLTESMHAIVMDGKDIEDIARRMEEYSKDRQFFESIQQQYLSGLMKLQIKLDEISNERKKEYEETFNKLIKEELKLPFTIAQILALATLNAK
jgi:hypothetical protein